MSAPRPITAAIKQLEQVAQELRETHTVNGVWPASEAETQLYYLRLQSTIRNAKHEWARVRQETLRLHQIESLPDSAA